MCAWYTVWEESVMILMDHLFAIVEVDTTEMGYNLAELSDQYQEQAVHVRQIPSVFESHSDSSYRFCFSGNGWDISKSVHVLEIELKLSLNEAQSLLAVWVQAIDSGFCGDSYNESSCHIYLFSRNPVDTCTSCKLFKSPPPPPPPPPFIHTITRRAVSTQQTSIH